ncbi:hypothetical protein [Methanolobus bombayensis]|nr:hypothetical protein [Methanolobus bombayensis]MBP1910324.1 metal-responsive CopG/Arc/MetJ family transcriptional regulator [Methanolobus bombayensis]
MRIYTDLPDELLDRLEMYIESFPYNIPRNPIIVKAVDDFLKKEGF